MVEWLGRLNLEGLVGRTFRSLIDDLYLCDRIVANVGGLGDFFFGVDRVNQLVRFLTTWTCLFTLSSNLISLRLRGNQRLQEKG